MGLSFYKPNNSNTGHGCSFSFNSKERGLYISIVKQVGPKLFKGGKNCNTKFSMAEIGDILLALEKGKPAKGFHHFPDSPVSTRFTFGPYYIGPDDNKQFKGFGLSVYRKDMQDSSAEEERFAISFTPGEGRVLRKYLEHVLDHFFTAIYSEDKQKRQASFDKKNEGQQKPAKKAAPKKKEPEETADDPFADDPFDASTDPNEDEAILAERIGEGAEEKTDKTSSADEDTHQVNDDVF